MDQLIGIYFLYIRTAFEYIQKYLRICRVTNRNSVYAKWYFKSVGKGWVIPCCIGNTGHSLERNVLSYVCGVSYINSLLIKDMNIKKKNIKIYL